MGFTPLALSTIAVIWHARYAAALHSTPLRHGAPRTAPSRRISPPRAAFRGGAASRVAPQYAASDDAQALLDEAAALRDEARELESTLPRQPALQTQQTRTPTSVPELAGSTWRFACRLDDVEGSGTTAFDFVATLEREADPALVEDDKRRGREVGPVSLVEPTPVIDRVFGWLSEDDGPDGEFARINVKAADGVLRPGDGNDIYLQARLKRDADGVRLDEGTLTVRRERPPARFLLFEFPALVADLKVVGSFSATPRAGGAG